MLCFWWKKTTDLSILKRMTPPHC